MQTSNDLKNTGNRTKWRERQDAIKELEKLFSWAEFYSLGGNVRHFEAWKETQQQIQDHKDHYGL